VIGPGATEFDTIVVDVVEEVLDVSTRVDVAGVTVDGDFVPDVENNATTSTAIAAQESATIKIRLGAARIFFISRRLYSNTFPARINGLSTTSAVIAPSHFFQLKGNCSLQANELAQ
jgi:hypothetical protein